MPLALLSGNVQYIVPPDETVAIFGFQLTVQTELFRLLHGNVQVSVQASKDSSVFNARIQFHFHRSTKHGFQKIRRRSLFCRFLDQGLNGGKFSVRMYNSIVSATTS